MHVAVVCPNCGSGNSVANVAVHHAEGLANYFKVSFISDSFPAKKPGIDYRSIAPNQFYWLRRFGHVPRELAFVRAAKTMLMRLCENGGLDFMLCHGHALTTLAADPVKRKYGVPHGLVTHGDIYDRPKGTYDRRLTWLYKSVTSGAYKSADLVFALSPYMGSLAQIGGAPKERIHIVANGIDPKELNLSSESILYPRIGETLRLLYVGRLSPEKDVETLLRACRILKDGGIKFSLDIIGDGPMKSVLKDLAQMLEIDRHVNFLGKIDRSQIGQHYLSSHIVCVPSLSDPLPTVVLEAMAAGRPVVGCRAGGIPFLVVDRVTGFITSPGSPEEFASAIVQFRQDKDLIIRMGQAAAVRVREHFAWPDLTNSLAEIIQSSVIRKTFDGNAVHVAN